MNCHDPELYYHFLNALYGCFQSSLIGFMKLWAHLIFDRKCIKHKLRCISWWVWPPSHWRHNSCHMVGLESLHMAQMAASYCQYRTAQGCCSHTALHLCWASSKEFNLIELDCHHSLRGACVVALGEWYSLQWHSMQKLCQLAHRGEGKDARCLAVASSHFWGREVHQDVLSILPENPSIPFRSCKRTSGVSTIPKGVRKPLRSAVSNLCFPVAPGNPAAVWANSQCGVPGWTGHRHLRGDGVQPVVPGIQNQRQEPVRYSQHTL